MKAAVFVLISLLLLLPACSAGTAKPHPSLGAVSTDVPLASAEPTPTPEPEYHIGTVIALEDSEFAYVRKEGTLKSDIIGAAAMGVELALTGHTEEWYRVIHGDRAGFIEKRYIEMKPGKEPLPRHDIYFIIPEKKQSGFNETKFDNMLKIENVTYTRSGKARQSIDIYTKSGTLLAKDATLEITEGVISAPPIVQSEVTSAPAAAHAPVKIVIKNGQVTASEGITLEQTEEFDAASDMGKVAAKDNTVIEFDGMFITGATVKVTRGTIYGEDGEVEIRPEAYLTPKKLKNNLVDVALYTKEIEIDVLFAKDGNLLGDRIYDYEVCLLQKGTLDKLLKAAKKFKEDGYKIVIFDAYRPYSVTVKLYEKYRNKYVAPLRPGSNHNKGAAIDMSLLDENGVPIEMPSPIHTLNSTSNRNSKKMSAAARANMNYMTKIMKSCGFRTIETEWWHFVDVDSNQYLRTDYDLNSVLRVIYD